MSKESYDAKAAKYFSGGWDESKHTRDEDGKFTDGTETSGTAEKSGSIDIPSPRGKSKTIDEFFGVEYKGLKGIDAIERLLIEKQGHVKGAFNRAELGGTGDIDIVWGDHTGGLDHLIKQRDKDIASGKGNISGADMARKVPGIIENGDIVIDHKERPGFEYEGYRVSIKPTFDGIKLNWVISAMEIKKPADS